MQVDQSASCNVLLRGYQEQDYCKPPRRSRNEPSVVSPENSPPFESAPGGGSPSCKASRSHVSLQAAQHRRQKTARFLPPLTWPFRNPTRRTSCSLPARLPRQRRVFPPRGTRWPPLCQMGHFKGPGLSRWPRPRSCPTSIRLAIPGDRMDQRMMGNLLKHKQGTQKQREERLIRNWWLGAREETSIIPTPVLRSLPLLGRR